jgi:hypothetical protein
VLPLSVAAKWLRRYVRREPLDTLATVTCAECDQSPRLAETWRILFADIAEAVTYYPECAEHEFEELARDS